MAKMTANGKRQLAEASTEWGEIAHSSYATTTNKTTWRLRSDGAVTLQVVFKTTPTRGAAYYSRSAATIIGHVTGTPSEMQVKFARHVVRRGAALKEAV